MTLKKKIFFVGHTTTATSVPTHPPTTPAPPTAPPHCALPHPPYPSTPPRMPAARAASLVRESRCDVELLERSNSRLGLSSLVGGDDGVGDGGEDAATAPPAPPPPPRAASARLLARAVTPANAWAASWVVNVFLLAAKVVAFAASNSKSVLASLADSAVDLASQVVLSLADRYVKKHDERYPVGRCGVLRGLGDCWRCGGGTIAPPPPDRPTTGRAARGSGERGAAATPPPHSPPPPARGWRRWACSRARASCPVARGARTERASKAARPSRRAG